MKRFHKVSGFIALLIVAYLVILYQFPKEAGRFPFLVFLLLSDYYLWKSFGRWFVRQSKPIKSILFLLYWLPLILLVITVGARMVGFAVFVNETIGIFVQGFIFSVYAAKLIPVLFLVVADLIKGLKFLIKKIHSKHKTHESKHKGQPISRSKFLRQIGLAGGGLLFFGLMAGMIKWVHDFKIHRHSLQLPNLPKSFSGLRIVQISDLHLGSWPSEKMLEEVVFRVNEMKPDLIFFTGDLVDYKTDEAFRFERILATLKAKSGIFTILGNHDYGDYMRWPDAEAKAENMRELFRFFKRIGWRLLKNENVLLSHHDGDIAILGVENWGAVARFPQYGDLKKASALTENASVRILLTHDPSHWDAIVNKDFPDIDLTFSGHTHGFQFGVEMKNFKWSPAQYAYKQWAGLYSKELPGQKPQFLYVNRGLGTVGYPGRVGILPEITVFELKA
jgi:uncharacterized protein